MSSQVDVVPPGRPATPAGTRGPERAVPAPAAAARGPIGTAGRIPALDGLRGIAILLVLVVHYYVTPPTAEHSPVHDFLRRLFSLSFVGVDLFFVLSGFLIGSILIDHRESRRLLPAFYVRRFFRIVPLYALLLATFFIARNVETLSSINRGTYFSSPVPLSTYFLFVQNVAMAWMRDIGPYWLGVSWSLSIEEQFYLAMPLIIQRLRLRQIAGLCLVGIVASPVLRMAAIEQGNNPLAAVFLLPMRADGLSWGVLCALLLREKAVLDWLRAHLVPVALSATVLGAGLVALSLQNHAAHSWPLAAYGYSACNVFFAIVLAAAVAAPESALVRILRIRPLCAVGTTSYFTYLFHTPVLFVLHWALFRRPPLHYSWAAWATTLLSLGVTFALGWVSWRLLESPLLRLGRKVAYA